jgi:hypothetical protein
MREGGSQLARRRLKRESAKVEALAESEALAKAGGKMGKHKVSGLKAGTDAFTLA